MKQILTFIFLILTVGIFAQSAEIIQSTVGNYLVCWETQEHSIHAQHFSAEGVPVGNNIEIDPQINSSNTSIFLNEDGTFACIRAGDDNSKLYLNNYSREGEPNQSDIELAFNAPSWTSEVHYLPNGDFVLVGEKDSWIQMKMFNKDGSEKGIVINVNDREHIGGDPIVVSNINGDFLISWTDHSVLKQVCAQLFDENGNAKGNNFMVNNNSIDVDCCHMHSITSSASGKFLVVWNESFMGKVQTAKYATIISEEGLPIVRDISLEGDILELLDFGSLGYPYLEEIKSFEDGFISFWPYGDEDGSSIYYQFLAEDGTLDYDVNYFLFCDEPCYGLSVDISKDGNIILLWMQEIYDQRAYFTQQWSLSTLTPISDLIRLDKLGATGIEVDEGGNTPDKYQLSQNYPNPFNPSTEIKYSIPNQSHVSIKVFDILGREVATLVNREQPVGNYEVEFDASSLTSGIYFYRIQTGEFVESKKMVLMK